MGQAATTTFLIPTAASVSLTTATAPTRNWNWKARPSLLLGVGVPGRSSGAPLARPNRSTGTPVSITTRDRDPATCGTFILPTVKSTAASKQASILFLHSEMLLWKAWQTNLTPRDPEKLAHVIKTAHDRGMKVIVYTTPVWFLKNTPREREQQIDPTPGPMGTVPHWGRPDNADLFFQQISRVFKEMSLDGFYFDGIYGNPEHLAASYYLTRATRELVGDHGILIYHGTGDTPSIGGSRTYCPSLNAYYNYILRGEGEEKRTDPEYVRYFLSSYNLSNSVCLSLYKTDEIPSAEQIDLTLRANVRYPMPLGLLVGDSPERAHFQEHYFSRLTPSLKAEIAGDLARRTGALERKLTRARALRWRLAGERELGKHLKPEDFVAPNMPLRGGYWRFEEPYGLGVFDSSIPQINGIFDGGVVRDKTTPAPSVP